MSLFDHFNDKELDILQARRVQRLNGDSESQQDGLGETALTITVRQEHYAMPVKMLTYVHVDVAVIPVPCVPPYIAGIANIRGHIVPVLDLSVLLNVPGSVEADVAMTLVVATNKDVAVAFLVENIGDIEAYQVDDVQSVPSTIVENEQTRAYLQGILPNGATLLDVAAILDDPALIVMEKVT